MFNEYAVRLAEWKRNSKKVLSKAISLLQTYAIGYPEIKLRLGLQTLGKPNQILFSTSGSAKTAQVLMEIFGFQAKHFSSIDYQDPERRCRLECVLGKRNGPSRSSGDRQFIFVNKRPSDQIQIQKAINSAYHEKGFSGFPCFIVNIILQSGTLDFASQ